MIGASPNCSNDPALSAKGPLRYSALRTIKAQIRVQGFSPDLLALLRTRVDAEVLVAIREQKILFAHADRLHLEQCLGAFRQCVRGTYASSPDEAQRWQNYATFVGMLTDLRASTATRVNQAITQMPQLSCEEMAELACSFAADWFQGIADQRWSSLQDELATVTLSATSRSALSKVRSLLEASLA